MQTCLNKGCRLMHVHKQGITMQTCLNKGCRLMHVQALQSNVFETEG